MSPPALLLEGAPHFRNKTVAAWLALTLGALGAHGLYLGRRRWWLPLVYSVLMLAGMLFAANWRESVFLHLLFVPVVAGILESVVLALRDPARFDALYNPRQEVSNRHGWPSVLTAVLGAVALVNIGLYWLTVIILAVYRALGWLDGGIY
ncbi:hypothetical protein [Alcaligenes sp. SDU_A2]|uniref:hypothetical protein n=1 Tax=Alcaligenes sp. SDU_A2 TaxID=3136634 RepID=UPI00311F4E6C